MVNYEQLLRIKEDVDQSSIEINKLEGKLASLMEDLNEQGFESVDDVKTHITELEEEVKDLESQLDKKLKKLEEQYEF
jgi:uncharacterized protein YoxC